jgi:hypothetical protein
MYYGDPEAADQQQATATWDASYQGVWHLDSLQDSTALTNHATAINTPTLAAPGKVGRAVNLNTAATNERIVMADSASLDTTATAGTFELWINWTEITTARYQRVLISSNVFNSTMRGYELSAQPDGDAYFYPCEGQTTECPGTNYNLVTSPFSVRIERDPSARETRTRRNRCDAELERRHCRRDHAFSAPTAPSRQAGNHTNSFSSHIVSRNSEYG